MVVLHIREGYRVSILLTTPLLYGVWARVATWPSTLVVLPRYKERVGLHYVVVFFPDIGVVNWCFYFSIQITSQLLIIMPSFLLYYLFSAS